MISCYQVQKPGLAASLVVQWLGLCLSTAGGTSSIPGPGTKVLHATQCHQKTPKKPVLASVSLFPCFPVLTRWAPCRGLPREPVLCPEPFHLLRLILESFPGGVCSLRSPSPKNSKLFLSPQSLCCLPPSRKQAPKGARAPSALLTVSSGSGACDSARPARLWAYKLHADSQPSQVSYEQKYL